jgi:hypothetical protein
MFIGIGLASAASAADFSADEQAVGQISTGMCAAQEPLQTPRS